MIERPYRDVSDSLAEANVCLKSGDVEKAYNLFRLLSFRSGSDPEIIAGLALCLDRLGRFSEGVRQWASLAHRYPEAYAGEFELHHVACLVSLGQIGRAKSILRSSSNRFVDNGMKLALLRRIAAIEDQGRSSRDENCSASDVPFAPGTAYSARASDILSSNPRLRSNYADLIADRHDNLSSLRFKSVIMVTYGRSGSTLLQGVLNTIDGMRFMGENEGAFFHLFEYVETIARLALRTDSDLPTSPFYGAGTLDTLAAKQAARATIDAYFAPTRRDNVPTCIGFKDVRYIDHPDRLEAYLDFLEDMFDGPAFVFLWRNHSEVLRSGWWKQTDRVKAAATLKEVERRAEYFARDRKNCFSITYEDLISISERLRGLFAFLGASFDLGRVEAVLTTPHSYNPERPEIRQMFESARRNMDK